MRQGTNKQEKPQIISKFTKHLFLMAVIKITMLLNPIIYIGKKCILIDLHNYKRSSDFKLNVCLVFRSRGVKNDKMHQSLAYI